MNQPSFGALPSKRDLRTISHTTTAVAPIITGGFDYKPEEIENQHKVGICTAISLTQNAKKAIGRPFSADFQYLLQKKYMDLNWDEGSAIFSALKVGKNYGFLPAEMFPYITEADRNLPYSEYIKKLQAIPEAEIQNLIHQCSDYKLSGYAKVDISGPQSIAKAVSDSKSGILCRYSVGSEWYTAPDGRISWNPADINPIRPPKTVESGHAITYAKFDYTVNQDGVHANTWGASWDKEGLCDIYLDKYAPTEAWIPYYGMTEAELEALKQKLQQQASILGRLIALWKILRGK